MSLGFGDVSVDGEFSSSNRGRSGGNVKSSWLPGWLQSNRVDSSEVFVELLYAIREGEYKLSSDEASAIKRCENDLQVRAATVGYMTGAGFYSAIGHAKLLTKSQPNRYLASFSMGLLGAYVGVRTGVRTCLGTLLNLEDSMLGGELRAIIQRLEPNDPLITAPPPKQRQQQERARGMSTEAGSGGGGGGTSASWAASSTQTSAAASQAAAEAKWRGVQPQPSPTSARRIFDGGRGAAAEEFTMEDDRAVAPPPPLRLPTAPPPAATPITHHRQRRDADSAFDEYDRGDAQLFTLAGMSAVEHGVGHDAWGGAEVSGAWAGVSNGDEGRGRGARGRGRGGKEQQKGGAGDGGGGGAGSTRGRTPDETGRPSVKQRRAEKREHWAQRVEELRERREARAGAGQDSAGASSSRSSGETPPANMRDLARDVDAAGEAARVATARRAGAVGLRKTVYGDLVDR